MRFVSLASGSKGNCSLVCTENTRILVDCGIATKRIEEGLRAFDLSIEDIDAVLVTHEHIDHIKGAKRLMAAYGKPVYATEGTLNGLFRVTKDEYFNYAGRGLMEPVRADFQFSIGDIDVLPFNTYHDVNEPCGFRLEAYENGIRKCAVQMTDCGYFDDYIAEHLMELDAALLEANHDMSMLANGPYPMVLKRRIMSRKGHMSNVNTGKLISEIYNPKLKSVLLGHLSAENNTHSIARDTVCREINGSLGNEILAAMDINVAPQDGLSKVLDI